MVYLDPMHRPVLLLFCCWLTSLAAKATPIRLMPGPSTYLIGARAGLLIDPTAALTFSQISAAEQAFRPVTQRYATFADTRPAYWFRFQLDRPASAPDYLLDVAFGNIRSIDLYVVDERGQVGHRWAGDDRLPTGRLIDAPTYLLPLDLPQAGLYTVYVRIYNHGPHAYFPLLLREETAAQSLNQRTGLGWGIYWGVLLLMLLYHLLIWGFTRKRGYLYLSLYLLTYLGFELTRGSNLGIRYLWPNSPWLAQRSLGIFSIFVLYAFTLFYGQILNLRGRTPKLYQTLLLLCGVGTLLLLNTVTGFFPQLSTQLMAILGSSPLVIIMFWAGLLTWRQGERSARFYIIASMCYAAGFLVFVLNRSGVWPTIHPLVHYAQNIGSLFEIVFMSIGLADYVRTEQRRRLTEERRNAQLERERFRAELDRQEAIENALTEGHIRERNRVADELHDQLGSVLFGIRAQLAELRQKAPDVESDLLQSLWDTVQQGYQDVRLISHSLWPNELEKQGFGNALQTLISRLNRIGRTRFTLQLSGAEDRLSRTARFHLYCICLELVNNILKHAQATEASVRFVADGSDLRLSVRDDGIGFQPGSRDGRGLRSVEERVAQLMGTFSVAQLPEGEGAWCQVLMPVPPPSERPGETG